MEPLQDAEIHLDNLTFREKFKIASGPGKLCRWMNIDKSYNGKPVDGEELYLTEPQTNDRHEIATAKRIGVDYAGDSADHEWRYFIKGNKFVSKL